MLREHLFSIVLPSVFTGYWLVTEARNNPPKISTMCWWFVTYLVALTATRWFITDEMTQLRGPCPFFIYLGIAVYFDEKISALEAFSLVFLSGLFTDLFFVFGSDLKFQPIGGAGYEDALFILPVCACLLMHYINYRKK